MIPVTEIFCLVSDFCKFFEKEVGKIFISNPNRKRNRKCSMELSKVITIIILYHESKMRTFKHFYKDFKSKNKYQNYFPALVSYTRFVQLQKYTIVPLLVLAKMLRGKKTGIYFIDSTPLAVCHNLRIKRNQVFKYFARRGKTSTGWFFGFKLHIVINNYGEIMDFTITPGNVDDRKVVDQLTRSLKGILIGDRGYISKNLLTNCNNRGLKLITNKKKNAKHRAIFSPRELYFLKKRRIVETIIGQLKSIYSVQHTRYRSISSLFVNVISGICAYFFKPSKIMVSYENLFEHQRLLLTSN